MKPLLSAVFFTLFAGVAASAPGESSPPKDGTAEITRGFTCETPAGWTQKNVSDGGLRYSDGRRSIGLARYGMPGSPFATPELYLRHLGDLSKDEKRGIVEVSGQKADRFVRNYELSIGDNEGSQQKEWIYEEIVVLKTKEGFWVLRFQSPSSLYTSSPKGVAIWKKFLKSFRLRRS